MISGSPPNILAFAQAIGTPSSAAFRGFPGIIKAMKLAHEKLNVGGVWRSDTAYLCQLGARLRGLSDGMKRLLHGLVAVNTSAKADVTRTREGRLATAGRPTSVVITNEAKYPVVRTIWKPAARPCMSTAPTPRASSA